ncbi:glycine radical domain-containing protein, partial [Staphylococcus epidermidis]|uniref:glycine radical domain-containing protein n=1 Tax=Staphylococcus epidermidis TaxID=1282 RepID=UPI0037DA6D8E
MPKHLTPFQKLHFQKHYPYYPSPPFIHYSQYPNLNHNLKPLQTLSHYPYHNLPYLPTNIPIHHSYPSRYHPHFQTTANRYTSPHSANTHPKTLD